MGPDLAGIRARLRAAVGPETFGPVTVDATDLDLLIKSAEHDAAEVERLLDLLDAAGWPAR